MGNQCTSEVWCDNNPPDEHPKTRRALTPRHAKKHDDDQHDEDEEEEDEDEYEDEDAEDDDGDHTDVDSIPYNDFDPSIHADSVETHRSGMSKTSKASSKASSKISSKPSSRPLSIQSDRSKASSKISKFSKDSKDSRESKASKDSKTSKASKASKHSAKLSDRSLGFAGLDSIPPLDLEEGSAEKEKVEATPGEEKPIFDEFGEQQPRKQFRILLLGAGESGKTTFTQQLTLLYNMQNMTMEERKRNTLTALHENIVQCISATAANAIRLNIELSTEDKERLESIKMSTRLDKVVAEDVEALWYSDAMQRSYAQKSKYWVLDTVDWLMENVHRFASEEYLPTRQDMVLSRRRTTGITEHTYVVDDVAFTIIDVGGQRSERRKWVQFFADVHCIVFFVSAIGFCKVLFEDRNTFQMKESLELFSSTFRVPAPQTGPRIDNDWQDYVFETTPIHVVFNKIDMLDECLQQYALNACFPSYQGQNNKRSVLCFLQQTFADRIVSIRSPPDTHFISAANEFDVQELFTKLTTFLVEKERAGLALNAFMGWEHKHGNMRTNALDRKQPKPVSGKPSDEATKKRQRQRIKRIRELMCEN